MYTPKYTHLNFSDRLRQWRSHFLSRWATQRAKMRKKVRKNWGKWSQIDWNLRKNKKSGTLAHPGLWGWLRTKVPCDAVPTWLLQFEYLRGYFGAAVCKKKNKQTNKYKKPKIATSYGGYSHVKTYGDVPQVWVCFLKEIPKHGFH